MQLSLKLTPTRLAAAVVLFALGAWGQSLVTFTANSPAVAADINNNFQTVRTPPGTIILYAGAATPPGWVDCDGRLATGYPELALVLGTTFGGGTEVRVPNFRGRVPVGIDSASTVVTTGAANALGRTGGVELTTEVPAHTHLMPTSCLSGVGTCANNMGFARGPEVPVPGLELPTGVSGDGGVSTMQPFLTVRYLIKT